MKRLSDLAGSGSVKSGPISVMPQPGFLFHCHSVFTVKCFTSPPESSQQYAQYFDVSLDGALFCVFFFFFLFFSHGFHLCSRPPFLKPNQITAVLRESLLSCLFSVDVPTHLSGNTQLHLHHGAQAHTWTARLDTNSLASPQPPRKIGFWILKKGEKSFTCINPVIWSQRGTASCNHNSAYYDFIK